MFWNIEKSYVKIYINNFYIDTNEKKSFSPGVGDFRIEATNDGS